MNKLAPSMLAADFNRLGEQLLAVQNSGADYLHVDVMDGMFVPSISFGMPVIESIRKNLSIPFDVHLMVQDPARYLETFKAVGADILTIHAEAQNHLDRTLSEIKKLGMKAGLALNPDTDLSVLNYVLDKVDMILVMSVNPGFGGQDFIEGTYRKLERLRNMLETEGVSHIDVEVDGGVRCDNVKRIIDAGANVLVAGSAVFRGDIEANVKALKSLM